MINYLPFMKQPEAKQGRLDMMDTQTSDLDIDVENGGESASLIDKSGISGYAKSKLETV